MSSNKRGSTFQARLQEPTKPSKIKRRRWRVQKFSRTEKIALLATGFIWTSVVWTVLAILLFQAEGAVWNWLLYQPSPALAQPLPTATPFDPQPTATSPPTPTATRVVAAPQLLPAPSVVASPTTTATPQPSPTSVPTATPEPSPTVEPSNSETDVVTAPEPTEPLPSPEPSPTVELLDPETDVVTAPEPTEPPSPPPATPEPSPTVEPSNNETDVVAAPEPTEPPPSPTATLTASAAAPIPTRIVIDSVGIDAPVIPVGWLAGELAGQPATVWEVADYAVGWHKNSARPGQAGNVVMAAHNNIKGEVFRYLDEVEIGDKIVAYAGQQAFEYEVTFTTVVKEAGEPLAARKRNAEWIAPTEDERLTLVTCWPYPRSTHRFIVVAKPRQHLATASR